MKKSQNPTDYIDAAKRHYNKDSFRIMKNTPTGEAPNSVDEKGKTIRKKRNNKS
jgi:hypothetical protein